jgi:hypothetical protein
LSSISHVVLLALSHVSAVIPNPVPKTDSCVVLIELEERVVGSIL